MSDTRLSVSVDQIYVPEDYLRPINEMAAQAIARLIEKEGQKTPIAVYRSSARQGGEKPYTLIYGARRLRAMIILGRNEIEAVLRKKAEATILTITDNLAMPSLDALEQAEYFTAYRIWWENEYGPISRGGDRKSNGHRDRLISNSAFSEKTNFYKDISDIFGFSERTARRLQSIGRLYPALRDVLRGTSYAKDQKYLKKLTKFGPSHQAGIAAALKFEPDLDNVLRIADPTTGREGVGRMETGDWREKQFVDAWEGMPRDRRSAALDKIGAISKPLDPWPKSFPPPPPIPVHGNASPLWRMMQNPYATLPAKLTYDQLEAMKAEIEREAEEEDYRAQSLSAKINAEEAARRETFEKQRAKAKAAKSRKPKRGRPPDTPAVKFFKKLTKQGVSSGLAERLVYTLEVRNDFWIAKEAHKLNESQQEEVAHLIDSGCDLEDAAYRVMEMLQSPKEVGLYSAIETPRDFEQRSNLKPI
jgi:hypothetical protein